MLLAFHWRRRRMPLGVGRPRRITDVEDAQAPETPYHPSWGGSYMLLSL